MDQLDFLSNCMSENLAQARHVANGRMTFNSFFIALTAGVLALLPEIGGQGHFSVAAMLCLVMLILSVITTVLVKRWNAIFQRHMAAARHCYEQIQTLLIKGGAAKLNFSPYEFADDGSKRDGRNIFMAFNLLIALIWLCLLVILLLKSGGIV